MKRFLSAILVLVMVCGLLPAAAITANAEHEHRAGDWWLSDDTGHWNQCVSGTNCEEKLNFAPHDLSEYAKYCTICENRLDHVCYNPEATCQIGGKCSYCPYGAPENPDNHVTYGTMIDDKTHKVVCGCGYVKVASEPHVLNSWDDVDGKPGMEESWCEVCFHAVMRPKQHSHSYSKATCTSPATCSCGATTGDKNPSNHAGGTEVKGAVAATEDNEGYTGDSYCKGCGVKTKTGKAIPKKTSGTTGSGIEPSTPGMEPGTSGTEPSAPGTDPSTPSTDVTDPGTTVTTPGTDPTDPSTSGSGSTAPDSGNKNDNTTAADNGAPDKGDSDSDGNSLLWLWISLIVIVVGGVVTAVILVKKKKSNV